MSLMITAAYVLKIFLLEIYNFASIKNGFLCHTNTDIGSWHLVLCLFQSLLTYLWTCKSFALPMFHDVLSKQDI